jgi:hypothetical protein
MHPNRLRFAIFSDRNPAMGSVASASEKVGKDRRTAAEQNILTQTEQGMAAAISSTLTAAGKVRDSMTEQLFHLTYGSPLLQALVGVDSQDLEGRLPAREARREQAQAKKRKELEAGFDQGAAAEAALRAIAYVRRAEGNVDKRAYAVVKQLHDAQPPGRPRTMAELKAVLRDQSALLRLDEERAVTAIPRLLPRDAVDRARALRAVQRVVSAQGELSPEGKRRLARAERLFDAEASSKPSEKREERHVRA